jgi:hypothetical protein
MKKNKCLIACPIFKDELEMALESDLSLDIQFMDYRIHNDAKRMFEELKKAVSVANGSDISLLVGSDCYCEVSISDFAKQINANIINEKNCIEAILGPERTDELQRDRTTIHTQGWVRMIRQSITDNGLMGDSIRIMLGYFERILLLDYGVKPYSDEDILTYYDLLQVPIEIEPVQLDYFKGVLNRLLE